MICFAVVCKYNVMWQCVYCVGLQLSVNKLKCGSEYKDLFCSCL